MAKIISEEKDISIRNACKIFGVSETCYRYKRKLSSEDDIIASQLMHLVGNQKNWGFGFGLGFGFLYLRNIKGFGWNHKRVYRIYKELALNMRIKPKRRVIREKPEKLIVPNTINDYWSMDFIAR